MTTSKSKPFINRELSWLEFNQRVLDEACDKSIPLLERLKFLAITSSNLDEFFMVRVGGLHMLEEQGITKQDPSGMTPRQQLTAISERVHRMATNQHRVFHEDILPGLAEQGMNMLQPDDLTESQRAFLQHVFEEELYPVITPMAVSSAYDFPLLVNQTISIAVRLKPNNTSDMKPRYAVLPLGRGVSRFITLPSADGSYSFIAAENVVCMHLDRFFPGEQVAECASFRITRNADMSVEEDLASDLLIEMEEVLSARKRSDCVRLEIKANITKTMLGFLCRTLKVDERNVYPIEGPLHYGDFMKIAAVDGFEQLKDEPWPPQPTPAVDLRQSLFDTLTKRNVLLYHPYESFEPVLQFIKEAADDPDVLAIKQILYRTSRNSPVVEALKHAAMKGKYVTAIVELKARFDEARNIEWARALEEAGVQVIYGVKGLKTHAKVCVVVRREADGIQRYIHFGTGNYNEITARLYSDVSYMTRDDDLGADASTFFNTITGYSQLQPLRRLNSAPVSLREKLIEMIDVETERKKQGQKAHIRAKFNSLADPDLIKALYAASKAGVKIDLNVRGICCLRPGVKGLSERITVVSIIDRYLEHSRIFQFHHGGEELVYISSADWMARNLDRRVELLVPIDDAAAKAQLIHILDTCFQDTVKAKRLMPDGTYEPIRPRTKRSAMRSQHALYLEARERVREQEQSQRTVFEPHKPPPSK